MKKYKSLLLFLCGVIFLCSCEVLVPHGSIYGVVVESSRVEPLAGLGVELYHLKGDHKSLLLKTVTYADGHFEFVDLIPGEYFLKVIAAGYDENTTEYYVTVESNRQARVDMQVKLLNTNITVTTEDPIINGAVVIFNCTIQSFGDEYTPKEVGFFYSMTNTPQVDGIKIKSSNNKSAELQNLKNGTYYVVAYAINDVGICYGDVKKFTYSGGLSVTIETLNVSNISYETATISAIIEITAPTSYWYSVESKGVLVSLEPTPLIESAIKTTITAPQNDIYVNLDNLEDGTTYYVRAFIQTLEEDDKLRAKEVVYYGNILSFTTPQRFPTITHNGIQYYVSPDQGIINGFNEGELKCFNLSINTFGYPYYYIDWYLPNIDELTLILDNATLIGDLQPGWYWSSTQASEDSYYGFYYKVNPDVDVIEQRVRCLHKKKKH